jgi:cobalt-zinc-cadmium resistance protein CzcA
LPGITTHAQKTISLESAIDSALKNNFSIQSSYINTERSRQLTGTSADIPKATIIGDYGQINSINNDTRFGISQTINFPTIYKRGKSMLEAETDKAVMESTLIKFASKDR